MSDGMSLSPIGIAEVVGLSVFKVMVAGLVSALVYRRSLRRKVVDKALPKQISFINRDLLLPLFIFSRCAEGITSELLGNLWPVPILMICFLAVGLLAGSAAAFLTRAPRNIASVMLTITTFSNVIGMPLPLVLSIIAGVPSLRDARDAQSRGVSYLFLCNIMQSIAMWSSAGWLLKSHTIGCSPCGTSRILSNDGDGGGGGDRSGYGGSALVKAGSIRSDAPTPDELPADTPPTTAYASDEQRGSRGDGSCPDDAGNEMTNGPGATFELELTDSGGSPTCRISNRGAQLQTPRECVDEAAHVDNRVAGPAISLRSACRSFVDSLGAPVYASLVGVCCGAIGPVRSLIVERDAPLRWLLDAMDLLGAGGVPLVLFVLGANLSGGVPTNTGLMPVRCLCAVVFAKLVVVPFCNLGLLLLALRLGLLRRDEAGLMPLTVLVVGASPTAMNINTIATMQGTGQKEVATCMFWIYALSPISVSVLAYIGMLLFVNTGTSEELMAPSSIVGSTL